MNSTARGIGLDMTPVSTGHSVRGVARYVTGLYAAVLSRHDKLADTVRTLTLEGPPQNVSTWRTLRSPVRPQDVDPFVALLADRFALRRSPPAYWHHTDPTIPFAPISPERTLVTLYDLIPMIQPHVWSMSRWHRRLFYRAYVTLLREARGVIAISQSSADSAAKLLGLHSGQVRIVHPVVTRPTLQPAALDKVSDDKSPVFVWVGVPDVHKRPGLAIQAFALLVRRGRPNAQLIFVGVHPARARATLISLASQLGVRGNVLFVDYLPDITLRHLYRASVLVASSQIEGFGLPPVEAILAGGRVAATPTSAYLETVGNCASFAIHDDANSLAEALEHAVTNSPSPAAVDALERRFSVDAVAAEVRDAYSYFGIL